MIRHRPRGSGHPYVADTAQRDPVDPVAGEPLRLGVRVSAHTAPVRLEWERDGVRQEPRLLVEVPRRERGRDADDGHLSAAQARSERNAGAREVRIEGLRAGEVLRYRFTDGETTTRWWSTGVAEWVEGAPGVCGALTARIVPGTAFRLLRGGETLRVRFGLPLAPDEHVVGFGERYDRVDQRGAALDAVVFEQYKDQAPTGRTYLPMPFAHVVGGGGWGFHLRTTRRSWFDVGAAEPDLLRIEVQTAPDGMLDTACYEGSPRAVLRAFLEETGVPEELPEWVFRLWASGNEWNTQAEVMRQVDLHRTHGIPLGTVVIEAWSDESTFTSFRDARAAIRDGAEPARLDDFRFSPDGAWPDPRGMVEELHERDVRVVLWQIPLLKMRPRPVGQLRADVEAAVRDAVLIREQGADGRLRPYRNRGWWFPRALMPDLTDERAARWWVDKRRYLVEEIGIDGFKTDGGEHAWGDDLVYLDGGRGDERNNVFPVAYAAAYGDLLRRAGKAPVTFSRAGFTGSTANGVYWAGDENSTWSAFRWSLTAGLSAAASGISYWGWDLAGFSGEVPTAELYLRSAAAATFVPIMQYHSEFNFHRRPSRDRTPWNIAERTGDDRVIPVFRRFARLRQRLVPYLAAGARRSITMREPLMRPLFFDRPDDPEVWRRPLQWMLGDALLVAPVVDEGASATSAYLPPGDWRDAFTGARVSGGVVVERVTPWNEAPVWVRETDWSRLAPVFEDAGDYSSPRRVSRGAMSASRPRKSR